MTVPPDAFASSMSSHWTTQLKNHLNPALQALWRQMAFVFNRQISDAAGARWEVLQPPTGSGKTQGLALYCSMLPLDSHPGVLIATRLKAQADGLADLINELGNRPLAYSHHSDRPLDLAEIQNSPVLIITHQAYANGLKAVSRNDSVRSNWDSFTQWRSGQRRLTVIDEALDAIDHVQVSFQDLSTFRGFIKGHIHHSPDMAALDAFFEAFRHRLIEDGTQSPERMISHCELGLFGKLDFSHLKNELLLRMRENKRAAEFDTELANRAIKMLSSLEALASDFRWYSKRGNLDTFNTARLIVPKSHPRAVVLDATASLDLIYELFEDRASIIPLPAHARRYENVTLRVSRGHKVGKHYLRERASEEWPKIVAAVEKENGRSRTVFACCHKDAEAQILATKHHFNQLSVCHWGAIDGLNHWSECDTAVIFGLPYLGTTIAANAFMAFKGPQTDEWLNNPRQRGYGQHRDVLQSYGELHITARVVQAINRTRCRRVIDAEGNCAPTDVFLLLPTGHLGDAVLAGLCRHMPGIKVVQWEAAAVTKRARRRKAEETLLAFCTTLSPGTYSASVIRSDLNISERTFKRLLETPKVSSRSLRQQLNSLGIQYVAGQGRGTHSVLVKLKSEMES